MAYLRCPILRRALRGGQLTLGGLLVGTVLVAAAFARAVAHHSGASDGRVDVVGVVGRTAVELGIQRRTGVGTRLLLRLGGIVDMAEELLAEGCGS